MPSAGVFFLFAGGHYEYEVEAVGSGEWWFSVVGVLGGLGDFGPPVFDVFGGFDHAAAADVAFGALWAGCSGDEALECGHVISSGMWGVVVFRGGIFRLVRGLGVVRGGCGGCGVAFS